MSRFSESEPLGAPASRQYIQFFKPRIVLMVMLASAMGYFLGAEHSFDPFSLAALLTGTGLTAAGGAALNNIIERDFDKLMDRTRERAIPLDRVGAGTAAAFCILLTAAGVILLVLGTNVLCAALAFLTAFIYIAIYTPLKRRTWLNTIVGAVSGALPPMGGWVAARGELGTGAWLVFLILFVWQLPHFFAIAWMYRADYGRAGFKMLSVLDPEGKRTVRHIILWSAILVPVSLLPVALGYLGPLYLFGAFACGLFFLASGFVMSESNSIEKARAVMHASLVYLPALFFLLLLDGGLKNL